MPAQFVQMPANLPNLRQLPGPAPQSNPAPGHRQAYRGPSVEQLHRQVPAPAQYAPVPGRTRAPARGPAPAPLARPAQPMSACVFSSVDASPVESHGDLTLLRWRNNGSIDALIQYVQGESALITAVEVAGRVLWSGTSGDPRVTFDPNMPVVPPGAEVRVTVRRAGHSGAPGAQLGVFGPMLGGSHVSGAEAAPAPAAAAPDLSLGTTLKRFVLQDSTTQIAAGLCLAALPVGLGLHYAGKPMGKSVAKYGAIGAAAVVAMSTTRALLGWGLGWGIGHVAGW